MKEYMSEYMGKLMNRRMDGCIYESLDGWMGGQRYGQMVRWIDG